MSMLTPSGMGGKYRVTGNAYPRMRRPRRRGRIVASLIASVVVLGLFGWGAVQLFHVFKGDDGDTKANAAPQNRPSCKPAPTPTATVKLAPMPQPSGVTLNVLNATAAAASPSPPPTSWPNAASRCRASATPCRPTTRRSPRRR